MTCDIDIKLPSLFDPLSPIGQQLLKEFGPAAGGLQEAFKRYAERNIWNIWGHGTFGVRP